MTLLLRNREIIGLMDLDQYIEAVETGYRDVGLGRGSNFPRQNVWIQGDPSESVGGGHLKANTKGSLKFKAALLPGLGAAGVWVGLVLGLACYAALLVVRFARLAHREYLPSTARTAAATVFS